MKKTIIKTSILLAAAGMVVILTTSKCSQPAPKPAPVILGADSIYNDILKLKKDLDLLGVDTCAETATANKNTDAAMLKKRTAFGTQIGLKDADTSEYGMICIGDILKMLVEENKPVHNNVILVYPTWDAVNKKFGVFCRGAYRTFDDEFSLKIDANATYNTANWCPNICPKK